MKHIQTFESFVNEKNDFLNEKKTWWDFEPEQIVKSLVKDNDKNASASDIDNWLDMFAQDKKIQDGTPKVLLDDIIEILNKKGYKLNSDEIVKIAPYKYTK